MIASPGGLAIGGYGEYYRPVVICYTMWIEKRMYVIMFNTKVCNEMIILRKTKWGGI